MNNTRKTGFNRRDRFYENADEINFDNSYFEASLTSDNTQGALEELDDRVQDLEGAGTTVGPTIDLVARNDLTLSNIQATPIAIPLDNRKGDHTAHITTGVSAGETRITFTQDAKYMIDVSVNPLNTNTSRSVYRTYVALNGVPLGADYEGYSYLRTTNQGNEASITNTVDVTNGDYIEVFIVRQTGGGVANILAENATVRLFKFDNLLQDSIHWDNVTDKPDLGLTPGDLLGSWDANTNTPTITSGTHSGATGDYYIVGTAGTTNIDGNASWAVNDWIVWSESQSVWLKIDNQSGVTSVNGQSGVVVLDSDDVNQGTTNLYFSQPERDKLAAIGPNAEQNVQADLGETDSGLDSFVLNKTADNIDYSNATSGLASTDVQAAIDELADLTPRYVDGSDTVILNSKTVVQTYTVPGGGLYTVNIAALGFTSILAVFAQGAQPAADLDTAPIVSIGDYSTTEIDFVTMESNTDAVLLGGTVDGLELDTDNTVTIHLMIVGT